MPRYRQGSKVPLNVYDGDRPLFQAHSVEDAERIVALLNIGERVETVTFGEIARALRVEAGTDVPGHTTDGEWDTFDNFDSDRITRVVMRLLTSPETPPGSPVPEIEPVGAQDPPESREGHTGLVIQEGASFRASESSARLLRHSDGLVYERVGDRCGFSYEHAPCNSCYRVYV